MWLLNYWTSSSSKLGTLMLEITMSVTTSTIGMAPSGPAPRVDSVAASGLRGEYSGTSVAAETLPGRCSQCN